MLAHAQATLLVAVGTLVLTVLLYVFIPKGFFPVQDTGQIEGISQAAQSTSYAAMAEHQQALADVILKDPAVLSLTSYIGVDGTNTTLNQGRFLINLKPKGERPSRQRSDPPAEPEAGRRARRASLYMQPVQSLTLNTTVSPTQYQFVLEDLNSSEFPTYVPRLMAKLQALPQLTDVASELEANGNSVYIDINRTNAARFGITAGDRGQRAVRRLRPAHHLDDFHADQPVPRDHDRRPAADDQHRFAGRDLSALLLRRRRAGAAFGHRQLRTPSPSR